MFVRSKNAQKFEYLYIAPLLLDCSSLQLVVGEVKGYLGGFLLTMYSLDLFVFLGTLSINNSHTCISFCKISVLHVDK